MKVGDDLSEDPVCRMCEEPYNARRIPRILDCGHCLCTACINCTIRSNKECPVCHSVTVALHASEFPVDQSLINITQGNVHKMHINNSIASTSTDFLSQKPLSIQTSDSACIDSVAMTSRSDESNAGKELQNKISTGEVVKRDTELKVSVAKAVTISMEYVSASYHRERSARQYSRRATTNRVFERLIVNTPNENSFPESACYTERVGSSQKILAQRINSTPGGGLEIPPEVFFTQFSVPPGGGNSSSWSTLRGPSAHIENAVESSVPIHELQDQIATETTNSQQMPQVEYEIVGKCLEHDRPVSFMCMGCNVWGCKSCSDHRVDREQCLLLDPLEAVNTLKVIFKDGVAAYVRNVQRIKNSLKRETSGIEKTANYYEKKAALIRAELDIVENNIKELKDYSNRSISTNSELNTLTKQLKSVYKSSKDSLSKDDQVKAMDVLQSSQVVLNKYPADDKKIPLIPNVRINKKKEIIELLEVGAPLYGVQIRNGEKKWSQLMLNGDHILLHCLREDVHPNDGVALLALPYEKLRKMVPESCATLFMDIGWAGERRGRVYVKMFGNTPRSRQAILLCSGENGPSYRNTVFYEKTEHSSWISTYQEILHGGDYEHNDGSGGKATMEDIVNGGEYRHAIVDGLMISWSAHEHWKLGSFSIYTQGDPNKYTDTGFGSVTEGLEILRAAAKQDPVTSSYVCDCGLTIPIERA